ncbi:hypothetical protein [Streptacidiphilus melanogenes]|uniref:hypothetical protein n=1 Tax=Streptacidiphilus melanogenes TaxID=411235 RepID=UPI00069372B3|nr:hypothetical protein [Streptacidiphilus melanogenes]
MDWFHGAAYGAVGGALIEALVFNGRVLAWQAARRQARESRRRKLPPLRAYVDPPADVAAALSRVLLGAVVGWLLRSQITGLYAAVAAGASAPALLRQLGSFRTVQEVVQGGAASPGERNPDTSEPVPPAAAHPQPPQTPETPGEVGS